MENKPFSHMNAIRLPHKATVLYFLQTQTDLINVTLPVKTKPTVSLYIKTEHQGYRGVQGAYGLAEGWTGRESCCSYGKKQKN